MDLSENRSNNPNLIASAQADQCVIAKQIYLQSMIIPSDDELVSCTLTSVNELTEELVAQLCAYNPEVIILATGEHIVFPDSEILTLLVKQHIGLEVLSNQAAARTFNVLLAENRKAVCLMIIQPDQ
jgi:uncharacterized protein